MSIFAKIAAASANGGGNWFKQGKYLLEVKKILVKNGFKGTTFIAEFEVLAATKTAETDPNAVGSGVSFVANLTGGDKTRNDMAASNVKNFFSGLLGSDAPSEAEMEQCCEVIDERGKVVQAASVNLCGFKVRTEAYLKEKKSKPGETFTAHRWENVPVSDEEIAAIQAKQKKA